MSHADHVTRVFTKLILKRNVYAAVHWVTKRACSGLLKFSDTIKYSHPWSGTVSETLLDVYVLTCCAPYHYLTIYPIWRMLRLLVCMFCQWLDNCKEALALEDVIPLIGEMPC